MNDWEESSAKIKHIGMKRALNEGDTYDEVPKTGNNKRIPPPWVKKDAQTEEWEKKREDEIKDMRQNKTYQFIMLLSGFTNEKMSKYWTRSESSNKQQSGTMYTGMDSMVTPVEEGDGVKPEVSTGMIEERNLDDIDTPVELQGSSASRSNPPTKAEAKQYHQWYINTPWADGLVYLTPMVYGHIEEAFMALTQRFEHLQDVPLQAFIESPRIRSLFARVVAMCIRISDVLSGKKYHLESTYRRVNMERQRLMNTFKHVQYVDNQLMFLKSNRNPRYASVASKWDIAQRLKLKDEVLNINKKKRFLY
jgi:hypothetical protein